MRNKMTRNNNILAKCANLSAILTIAIAAGACSDTKYDYPEGSTKETRYKGQPTAVKSNEGGLFGAGGIKLFGGDDKKKGDDSGIAVNSYLWRGALDTIAFMPLASADPFGGVIITDWYSPPETPQERVKVQVLILDRDLRADGVKATVHRQRMTPQGWADQAVEPKTATELENAILTRARQLRIAQLGS